MAATRATLTAVPTPRPTRRDADATRPDLRVVPAPRPTAAIVLVALVVVFGVLLATAALNTMLVSGQRDLDRMETEIREGERRNQALALEVAELETPDRIKEAALAAGMVEPDEVTWVAPRPDGTSDAVTEPTAGPATDERADGEGATDGSTEVSDSTEASDAADVSDSADVSDGLDG